MAALYMMTTTTMTIMEEAGTADTIILHGIATGTDRRLLQGMVIDRRHLQATPGIGPRRHRRETVTGLLLLQANALISARETVQNNVPISARGIALNSAPIFVKEIVRNIVNIPVLNNALSGAQKIAPNAILSPAKVLVPAATTVMGA